MGSAGGSKLGVGLKKEYGNDQAGVVPLRNWNPQNGAMVLTCSFEFPFEHIKIGAASNKTTSHIKKKASVHGLIATNGLDAPGGNF